MIISISGRKSAGKSVLSQLVVDRGFTKVSFANPLKEYLAQLYNWNFVDLVTQEGKEQILPVPVKWNSEQSQILSDIIGILIPFNNQEKEFRSRREALQYIGTDVLRNFDPDFHIKRFKEKYSDGKNYVCDDLRFPNELQTIKEMNGVSIFLIRPYFWEYSNHISEIGLNRDEFEYVMFNDGSEKKLKRKFSMFLDCLFSNKKKPISRADFIKGFQESNYDTTVFSRKLNCSRDKIVWWATKYMVSIPRNTYALNHGAFKNTTPETAYWAGFISADGSVKKHLKHDYLLDLSSTDKDVVESFQKFLKTDKPIDCRDSYWNLGKKKYALTVSSPQLIEDLKLWCVEPKKSRFNKIPDIIRDNDELMCYWLVGLIDGDGSVYVTKNNYLSIQVLASAEIVDFIANWSKINCKKYSEKGIYNLYSLQFHGTYAIELYKKIYRGMGLKRKWGKVLPFLQTK